MKSFMTMLSPVILAVFVVLTNQVSATSITETKAAIGDGCNNSGPNSIAMGVYTTASNFASTAMGYLTTASGYISTAMGYDTTASGQYSTAIGESNIAGGNWSFAGGRYMKLSTTADGTFIWGNGEDLPYPSISTSNAFLIFPLGTPGKVGIGTTDPKQIMHVVGSNPRILVEGSTGNAEINLRNSGDTSSSVWAIYKDSGNHDLRFFQGTNKLTIQNTTGNVGIATTSPAKKLYVNGSAGGTTAWNASDGREKTEIKSIENALENILELRGISYRWKRGDEQESHGFDNKTHFGVIAQEVEAVYPDLVDNPGITEKRKHVEYNGLIGVLIEALRELKALNEKQQVEIEELRSMIKEFKS